MEGFVERGRTSHGRVPMCSLKFLSNTCVCYCFYCGRMFTILFKCLIEKTNIGRPIGWGGSVGLDEPPTEAIEFHLT